MQISILYNLRVHRMSNLEIDKLQQLHKTGVASGPIPSAKSSNLRGGQRAQVKQTTRDCTNFTGF